MSGGRKRAKAAVPGTRGTLRAAAARSVSRARRLLLFTLAAAVVCTAALGFLEGGPRWLAAALTVLVLGAALLEALAVLRQLDHVFQLLEKAEAQHEELRRAQSEAENLTHLLVHDMKGPLTGLIGLAEVIASELDDPARADVKRIEEQGRRLEAMVTDLLEIARLERGILGSPAEPVDLSVLLTSVAEAYRGRVRQLGAAIEVRVERGLVAPLQHEMIQRFLDNLMLNALDFVAAGGRIELAASGQGAGLVLSVRNTGDPIPPEVRDRLFKKTSVVSRRSRHNLGLGLYFCKLVAVAHDGTIGIEDEEGWAASVVARLPIETRSDPPPGLPSLSAAAAPEG